MLGDQSNDTRELVMSFDDSDCFRYSTMSRNNGVVMTLDDFGLFGEWNNNAIVAPDSTVMENGGVK